MFTLANISKCFLHLILISLKTMLNNKNSCILICRTSTCDMSCQPFKFAIMLTQMFTGLLPWIHCCDTIGRQPRWSRCGYCHNIHKQSSLFIWVSRKNGRKSSVIDKHSSHDIYLSNILHRIFLDARFQQQIPKWSWSNKWFRSKKCHVHSKWLFR